MSTARVVRAGRVGAIYDRDARADFDLAWFDRGWWHDAGARTHSSTGRGSVLMLERGDETWVLRHYHRGGIVSRFVYDHYLWTGLERSRPFREWRLLADMHALALPVPRPVAARAVRSGPLYQADIITVLLPATRPLSALLSAADVEAAVWPRIGAMLKRFHDTGIDHRDLTAHNILVGAGGEPALVDFDNATRRPSGSWKRARMARLERSLRKVAAETGTAFDGPGWRTLLAAYSTDSA